MFFANLVKNAIEKIIKKEVKKCIRSAKSSVEQNEKNSSDLNMNKRKALRM